MNINIGLCGLGNMGKKHKSTIEKNQLCNLTSVFDPGIEEYSSWDKFSSSLGELDGVIIACPSEHHVEVCKKVLTINPKVKVLLEKPISDSVKSAIELIPWQRNILVGQVERFNPAVIAMRNEWVKGNTGNVFSVQTRRYSYPNRPLKKENADVSTDLLVHDVDAIKYIFDMKLEKVSHVSRSITPGFTELVNLRLTDSKNTYITCCSNWVTPKSLRDMTILCEQGMYVLDYVDQSLSLYAISNGQQVRKGIYFSPERKFPLDGELQHFLDMIVDDVLPTCSVSDAIDTLKLLMEK